MGWKLILACSLEIVIDETCLLIKYEVLITIEYNLSCYEIIFKRIYFWEGIFFLESCVRRWTDVKTFCWSCSWNYLKRKWIWNSDFRWKICLKWVVGKSWWKRTSRLWVITLEISLRKEDFCWTKASPYKSRIAQDYGTQRKFCQIRPLLFNGERKVSTLFKLQWTLPC